MNGNRGIRRLAAAGMAGAAVFAGSVLLMHMVQPELSAWNDAVSYYMNGAWGWMLGAGLIAMGLGSLCLMAAIRRSVGGALVGHLALGLWSAGAVIGGVIPPDPIGSWSKPPSVPGMIHGGAAMVALLAFPVAAVVLSHARGWRMGAGRLLPVMAWVCVALLTVFFVSLLPVFSHHAPHGLGVTERLLLLGYVAWLWMAGWAVRRR